LARRIFECRDERAIDTQLLRIRIRAKCGITSRESSTRGVDGQQKGADINWRKEGSKEKKKKRRLPAVRAEWSRDFPALGRLDAV